MNIKHKTIHTEQQNQHLNSRHNDQNISYKTYNQIQKHYQKQKRRGNNKNRLILILLSLLLIIGSITLYRYIQLSNKYNEKTSINVVFSQVNVENDHRNTQNSIQIQQDFSKINNPTLKMKINEGKSFIIQQKYPQIKEIQQKIPELLSSKQKNNYNSQKKSIINNNQKQNVQQQILNQQKKQQLQNQGQKRQQQNFLSEGQIVKFNEKSDNSQIQINKKQTKIQQNHQNLNQNQKNIQTNQIQKQQKQQGQINSIKKNNQKKQSQKYKSIPIHNQNKKQKNKKSQKQKKQETQPKQKQNKKNQIKQQNKQIMKFEDPILNVKDQIAKNFKTTFQKSIYIKKGTKITPQQYYNAQKTMDLWKYFNVKTKNLQFLQESFLNIDKQQNDQIIISQMIKHIQYQQKLFERKYHISKYEQIPFCIIVPSYKNSDKYFRNINSIFQQNYQNLHVIYIDDASKDSTADLIRNYIDKYSIPDEKITFIENQVNKRALPNIDYVARNICKSGQIMVIIDGDDYLIGRQVLKVINAEYQKKKLLALYTNHIRVHEPIYLKVGTCIQYPHNVKKARAYRHFSIFPASHLRTFYVDLYWKISPRDLKDTRGQYFHAANDFAIMMPILQMAGQRFQYLPQLTYVYDANTGNNNFQTKTALQAKNFNTTKRRPKYPKLAQQTQFAKIQISKISEKNNQK